jgi:hypothetical protein
MKNIDRLFIEKIIDQDADYLNHIEDNIKIIENYENYFEKIVLFKKFSIEKPAKYYLQNKVKKNEDNIQENIKLEIDQLNNQYPDNFYFTNIKKTILKKKENKHIYNVYTLSVTEYKRVNIISDILYETEFYDSMYYLYKPFQNINLPTIHKIKLYQDIEDAINLKEIYTDTDEENDFNYHNRFLIYIKVVLYDFLANIFDIHNHLYLELLELISCLDKKVLSNDYIDMHTILQNNIDKPEINRILDILIQLKLDVNSYLLNDNVLEKLSNKTY